MARWVGFAAKATVFCVVLVAVTGAAAAGGVLAVAQMTGQGPKQVVAKALSMLPEAAGGSYDDLADNIIALRTEFSTAFAGLEARVATLESRAAGHGGVLRPDRAVAPIPIQLELPPMEAAPTTRFGGAITEKQLRKTPTTAPPDFAYTPPQQPDVCAEGCRFQTLQRAYDMAKPGDAITLAPGFYPECLVVKKDVLIVGQKGAKGERAEFDSACGGKGAFVVRADRFELRGVAIRDISVPDRNGACVRMDPRAGAVRLNDVICSNSENGVLGAARGPVFIDSSLFIGNGKDGRAHGIYITSAAELVIRNTIIQSTRDGGHTLKSGVARTIIQSSILAALDGGNSRAIDFYGGGTLVVTDSVLQQGPNSQNHDVIHIAGEGRRLNLSAEQIALIEDSWIIYDYKPGRCCRWLAAGRDLGPVIFRNDRIVGINDNRLDGATMDGNQEFETRQEAGLGPYTGKLQDLPFPKAWQR